MEHSLSVVWTVASLSTTSGGPTRSVLSASNALAEAGVRVTVFSMDYAEQENSSQSVNGSVELRTVRGYPLPMARDGIAPGFGRALSRLIAERQVDIVHDNGLWLYPNRCAARVAQACRVPLVVSTRGMLAPWALKHRRWKKQIAWALYQRRILERAALLHATVDAEAKDIRAAGLRNPIAVIPNAVEFPGTLPERQHHGGRRRVLFLGRLHPIKGLENLLKAWANVRPQGWELVLAGPDEEGYQARLQAVVSQGGLEREVRFLGAVDDEAKWRLYRSANLFVLPSFSENFGMVVAEALACEVPVIATQGTPWAELETQRCGWCVQIGAEGLTGALRAATMLGDDQRCEMGLRGRRFVQARCSRTKIAKDFCEVYGWVASSAQRPDCVRLG